MAARSFQSGRGWRSMEKRGDFKNKWGMDRGNREGSNHPKMSAIQQRSVLVQYQYSIASPTRDKKNLFAVNHYIGSWSRYNGRSDPRRSKEVRDHVVNKHLWILYVIDSVLTTQDKLVNFSLPFPLFLHLQR